MQTLWIRHCFRYSREPSTSCRWFTLYVKQWRIQRPIRPRLAFYVDPEMPIPLRPFRTIFEAPDTLLRRFALEPH